MPGDLAVTHDQDCVPAVRQSAEPAVIARAAIVGLGVLRDDCPVIDQRNLDGATARQRVGVGGDDLIGVGRDVALDVLQALRRLSRNVSRRRRVEQTVLRRRCGILSSGIPRRASV